MPESRDPFEYVSWCDGPSVDISPLVDFPICDTVNYNNPTLDIHRVAMTIPDLAPPPMCPCIWSFDTESPGHAVVSLTAISRAAAGGRIVVVPQLGDSQNCCEPSFQIEFDLNLPCVPFDFTATGTATGIGTFDIAMVISGCVVKFSYVMSIPCIAFSVENNISTPNIGSLAMGLVVNTADCKLKLSAKLSMPTETQTVIVSVRLDEINGFQVYRKELKVYEIVNDIGWQTIISVGSCTT
jgi:hypothetical protein